MTPDNFIQSDNSTYSQSPSTNFSLIPQAYAAGNNSPTGGRSFVCSVARMSAGAAKKSTELLGQSYKMPLRVIGGGLFGNKVGSGDPPPPIGDELKQRYLNLDRAILVLLMSLLSQDSKACFDHNYDALFQSAIDFTLLASQHYEQKVGLANLQGIRRNSKYRPVIDILKEGIRDAQAKNKDLKISYNRDDAVVIEKMMDGVINTPLNENECPLYENMCEDIVGKKSPEQAMVTELQGKIKELEFDRILDIYNSKSGQAVRRRIDRLKLPKRVSRIISSTENAYIPTDEFDPEEIIKEIEREREKTGRPVSVSVPLSIFIAKSNGDLTQAIDWTFQFLKYATRTRNASVGQGSDSDNDELNTAWMQKNINDEFSLDMDYSSLPLKEVTFSDGKIYYDFSAKNRVGSPYHVMNILALGNYFSPRLVRAMIFAEYLTAGSRHGAGKFSADLIVLQDLDNLERFLNGYNSLNPGQWKSQCN